MRVAYHLLSAVPLGLAWALAGHPLAGLAAAGAAVLLDADHVLDYALTRGRLASLQTMRTAFETFDIPRNYFFLHSWECVLVALVAAWLLRWTLLWALLSGWALHLALDQAYNTVFLGRYNVRPLFYFLLFRWRLGFDVPALRQAFPPRGPK